MKLKLKSSYHIVDDQNRIVMAEGRMALLEAIEDTGSINRAAKKMGMSYKTAWSKLRSSEAHLREKIVNSDKVNGTRLTGVGKALLATYKQMKRQCIRADDAIFDSFFCNSGQESIAPLVNHPPILSFVGHSGSGKTTFIEKLIPLLTDAGIKTAIIKHDVHGFEMDKPGKDTWRHKRAGAIATIISSSNKIGMILDADHDHRPDELATFLGVADLIITEGYKQGPHAKIEVFRPDATGDTKPLCRQDQQLIAIIADVSISMRLPIFGTNDIESVSNFIIRYFKFKRENHVDI